PIERDKAHIALQDAEAKRLALLAKERGAQADLKAFELQLDYYELKAPITGRLGTVQAVPGQTLPIGTVVAEVVDLNEIDVLCMAPPAAAARLKLGQTAVLKGLGAISDGSAPTGKVVYIAVQAQAETGNFPVKIRFLNPDLRLRANAVVRVDVLTDQERERLSIREIVLQEDQDPPSVIVVEDVETKKHDAGQEEKIGKAKKLIARIGVRDRDKQRVELLGLEDPEKKSPVSSEGLLFIIEGAQGLHDGDLVKLVEEEKAKGE
ncbi:MAG: efflux RND transporter periplasmic adaptor subunit, partial [Candidatus Acidiferrum sp.]